MNVKKMFLCGLTLLVIASNQLIKAQSVNPQRDMWTLGNNIIKFDPFTNVLQTTIGTLPYTGPSAWAPSPNQTVSNAYHDENGDLLFYIADSKVYDWEGRYIGSLFYLLGTGAVPVPGGSSDAVGLINGHNEIAIVPDKCNPRVFYLVAGDRFTNGHNSTSGGLNPWHVEPKYTKLEIDDDINAYRADNASNLGSIYGDELADGRLGFANDYFDYSDPFTGYIGAPMHNLVTNTSGNQNEPLFSVAVSKVQVDGVRLLFASTGAETAIFTNVELAAAGSIDQLSIPNSIYSSLTFGNQNGDVESELYQGIGSPTIRLANKYDAQNYYYTDYTYLNNAITVGPLQLLNDPLIITTRKDYGLEFSPNGRYLYYTYTNGLSYFDLNQINPSSISLSTQVNIGTFKSSQIEIGKDDALYFCNGTQLGRLTNLNNPTSINQSNFSTINLPNVVAQSATLFGTNSGSQTLDGFLYSFNDQVDGEPAYPVIPVGTSLEEAKCCRERKRYNKVEFAANGDANLADVNYYVGTNKFNQVWSPGALNNPFKSVNGIVAIKDRLIIPAGYTVTINNMTFEYKIFLNDPNNSTVLAPFIDGAKCILQRSTSNTLNGGVLILNNTVFTSISSCIGMWNGIEVQGNPSAVQQTISGSPIIIKSQQAKLLVNTGSTIRDAYFGASNYEFDLTNGVSNGIFHNTTNLSSGGIIIANNSTFKNNFIGVCFLPYATANVLSKFTRTNFLVDAALNNPLIGPNSMATLMGIKNLLFSSCNFKNLATTDYPIFPTNGTGLMGILSYDASFTVKGGVGVSVPYGTGCVFENLGFGIRAFNWTSNTILAQSSVFKNNWRGSYFGGFDGTSVTKVQRNKYFVYEQPNGTPAMDAAYGHYLDNCNDFIVQENNFHYNSYNETTQSHIGGAFNSYGCIVNQENPAQDCEGINGYRGDRVYKNLFKHINIGAQAQGSNAEHPNDIGNPVDPNNCHPNGTSHNQGLKYICNTFDKTDANDITVMQNALVQMEGRIANGQEQGAAAGNEFYHISGCNVTNTSIEREIYIDKSLITNANPNYIQYHYFGTFNQTPNCYSPLAVAPNPGSTLLNTGNFIPTINNKNGCLSQINTLSNTGNTQAHRQIGVLISDLTQKLAGGNTEILITLISTATGGQIKTGLLDKSPYLSDRVLIAAIQKNLPDLIIREILMANSPVTDKVKQAMNVSTISVGVKNQVNAQQGQSERANAERQMTKLKDEQHVFEIESYYTSQTDSLINNTDSLVNFINYIGGNEAVNKKIKAHLSKNELVKANQELSIMATNLGTSHPDYQYLHMMSDIYGTHQKGALGIMNDVSALSIVESTSQRITEYDSKGAEGIKDFLRLSRYHEWIQGFPNSSHQRLANEIKDTETETVILSDHFKLYPNPTSGLLNYEFDFGDKNTDKLTIEIYNLIGSKLLSYTITSENNKGILHLNDLSNGMYLINMIDSKQQKYTTKINVLK